MLFSIPVPRKSLSAVFSFLLFSLLLLAWSIGNTRGQDIIGDISFFGGMKDRSTGSPGCEQAADYILKSFKEAGLSEVGTQEFITPTPSSASASIEVNGKISEVFPWGANLAYLPKTPDEGLSGPLIYVANGDFRNFSEKTIEGSIILMDMDSRANWLNAAMLGAGALIYIGDEKSIDGVFKEKTTATPLAFPRFWIRREEGEKLKQLSTLPMLQAKVKSNSTWQNRLVKNCYAVLPGKSPELKNEVIVLEAFYDASSYLLGMAPGADEATSITVLLSLARSLAKDPPDRTVLFLATAGNGQSLAGMRQFVWTATARKKLLRKETKELQETKQQADHLGSLLQKDDPLAVEDPDDRQIVWRTIVEEAKNKADALTRESRYQKALAQAEPASEIEEARPYRRLSWLTRIEDMTPEQHSLAVRLLKAAKQTIEDRQNELKLRLDVAKSTNSFRSVLDDYNPVLYLSLNLSSNSSRVGLVEMGDTYPLRESIKRVTRATRLAAILRQSSSEVVNETGLPDFIKSTDRGGLIQGDSGHALSGRPVSSDVGVLAGLPSISLMSLDDYRSYWSTPEDTLDRVDMKNTAIICRFLPHLFKKIFSHPSLPASLERGIDGFASLEGNAMFIRQGELFADQPAPNTIISVLQGNSVLRAMVFQDGTFFIPGLANNRVALEKLILEPYGIDLGSGRIAWTADKVQTGKNNYRIKVKTDLASTSLTMFHCLQTDVVRAFNPQDMSYLTKVELLDAATEAPPLRYWYSRVDGRNTMAISVFLEKGTRFKLIMAESLLHNELFLLNSSQHDKKGRGFLIGAPPTVTLAPYRVAKDLHLLLGERLDNLFRHGIVNRRLQTLYEASARELSESQGYLESNRFDHFWTNVISAWAKLNIIYREIEGTQRDVLAGVMFFIALFVPFAYCMERYLFAFRTVYRQLAAFFLILLCTIFIIRALHPAFQLTYSPMVVIIAFFIVGLSLLVSWIVFMRFEKEMADMHNKSAHLRTPQVSKWQSFGAGFSIGVSNLNRRKLRTGLTCLTLIILTFTVMSFTNVKSLHKTTDTRINQTNPYKGILLRHQYWLPLTHLILEDMENRFAGIASIWPRSWIEPENPSDRKLALVENNQAKASVEGVLGVGANAPGYFLRMVTHGRWFSPGETNAILVPLSVAKQLQLDPEKDVGVQVNVMGDPFTIIGYFDGSVMESLKDLDQNPITPAYLEVSRSDDISEVEIEAMQSGEQILPATERFRYANADATIIMPYQKCINYGGALKSVAILPSKSESALAIADSLSLWLAYPLFVGEDGTWYHSASTTIRYQGVANLLVPILIVIFITLNTMIGHVHERQREIGTYTSVGLAPTHVGFLFIVEALSLAVISTVIGYILAQLSAKTLANTEFFSQLTFNYSSLASVACMFLVFSVVFLAALYPARMAAEIAMPDVNRSWQLPSPEGDVIHMTLPFLLKHEEEGGVMGFLSKFYGSHQYVAHECFIVDDLNLTKEAPGAETYEMSSPACLFLCMNTWLAPFDFGIKQRVQLHCCESPENPGYLEVSIHMVRISGERSAWERANRNFIKALRKQMLLWRLLDSEAKAAYNAA